MVPITASLSVKVSPSNAFLQLLFVLGNVVMFGYRSRISPTRASLELLNPHRRNEEGKL